MNGLATVDIPKPLRVKFLAKMPEEQVAGLWSPLLPPAGFEGVEFTFDSNDKNYDFLAVYEGLPKWDGRKKAGRFETLSCVRENTILITTEPSSIRIDGPHFMKQFGHVLTSKSPRLTQHPNHISETPPLRWFYGRSFKNPNKHLSIADLSAACPEKTKILSTVCSTKRMSHTVHAARLEFVKALKFRLPELNIYGRGMKPISDKAEAMGNYKYHIAIENHIESGHWTEKLADCFLAGCLPFYFGDPEYANSFPADSVIPIDIFNLEQTVAIIRKAIAEDAYSQRQPALQEAKRRILDNHNTLSWVARFALKNFADNASSESARIYNRHAFRRHRPAKALSDLIFRTRMKTHPDASPLQFTRSVPRSREA